MKTIFINFILLLAVPFSFSQSIFADLRTLDGAFISSEKVVSGNQGTILVFWKVGNETCYDNLENLQEVWAGTIKAMGVRLVAICENDGINWPKVKPLVYGKDWDFDIYIDMNGDFKRLMEVNDFPYTLLLDNKEEIKCRYSGYCNGDEEQLCSKISHCLKEKGGLEDFE